MQEIQRMSEIDYFVHNCTERIERVPGHLNGEVPAQLLHKLEFRNYVPAKLSHWPEFHYDVPAQLLQ